MAIVERAAMEDGPLAAEPASSSYSAKPASAAPKKTVSRSKRLTLDELWTRSRQLGPRSKTESTAIVRALRDERYGR